MITAHVVHRDPEICGGEAVFVGTRVLVQALVDYIVAGHTVDEFLAHFTSVDREQAVGFLRQAVQAVVDRLPGSTHDD